LFGSLDQPVQWICPLSFEAIAPDQETLPGIGLSCGVIPAPLQSAAVFDVIFIELKASYHLLSWSGK
jgi:hypothetical protein